jgi:hypothetical protein
MVSVITNEEARQLENTLPADTTQLDNTASQITMQKQTFDLDSIFLMQHASMQ